MSCRRCPLPRSGARMSRRPCYACSRVAEFGGRRGDAGCPELKAILGQSNMSVKLVLPCLDSSLSVSIGVPTLASHSIALHGCSPTAVAEGMNARLESIMEAATTQRVVWGGDLTSIELPSATGYPRERNRPRFVHFTGLLQDLMSTHRSSQLPLSPGMLLIFSKANS